MSDNPGDPTLNVLLKVVTDRAAMKRAKDELAAHVSDIQKKVSRAETVATSVGGGSLLARLNAAAIAKRNALAAAKNPTGSVKASTLSAPKAAVAQAAKADAKVYAQTFASTVEKMRGDIFKKLSANPAPYERDTVLAAGGLSPDKIKEADVELQRAGNSVKNIERALKRVNIPDDQARALAIALKEADYEAKAIRSRTMGRFTQLRRTAEQGVRLSEVGFSVGAAGGAMLAPLALGANQYAQRYQGFEQLANKYTKIQYDQARAVEKFGRSASESLIPILETLTDILNRLTDFVKNNPFILKAIANAGALLTVVGSLAVVFGRLQSIIARVALLTLPGVPGSLTNFLHARSGLGAGEAPGAAAALGAGLLKLGAVVAGTALAFNAFGAVIDTTKGSAIGLQERMDVTGDGFVNFDDVLAAARVGIYTLVDGFFRVATAIATFIEQLATFPERIKNFATTGNFITDVERTKTDQVRKAETRIGAIEEQKSLLRQSFNARFDPETIAAIALREGKDVQKALFNAAFNGDAVKAQEELNAALEKLSDEEAKLREEVAKLNAKTEGGLSPAAQSVENERVRVLGQMGNFVKTGDLGSLFSGLFGKVLPGLFGNKETTPTTGTAAQDYDPDAVRLYMSFRQANLEAEREYQNQLKDQKKAFQLDALRAEREYNRSLYDAALERQRDERDAWAKHQFDLSEMQIDFDREEIKAARDRAKERAKALRELYDKLFEFAAARDVAGFVEEQKRFRAQQREEDIQAGIEKAERARKFADEVAEKNRQYAFDREQARIAYNDKLIDMKRSFETEKRERQKSFDEQLAQAQIEYGRQKDARTRDFATQLADLESNQAGLKTLRDAFYVESITSYTNYLNANKAVLNSALAEVYGRMGVGRTAEPPTRVRGIPTGIPTHADGLPYVPHDNYIANLHKGERVLTSRENQEWGMFLGGQRTRSIIVNVSGNAIGNVVSQGDLETFGHEIAMAIREGVA